MVSVISRRGEVHVEVIGASAVGGATPIFPVISTPRGWGFGVAISTRRHHPSAPVGQYGWDGGLGTIWRNDPGDGLVAIRLTNVAWTSPRPPEIARDFLTAVYAAITD